MSRKMAQQMGGAFLDALRLSSDFRANERGYAGDLFDQLVTVLPEPEAWTVSGTGDQAELLILAGDVLFSVAREPAPDGTTLLAINCTRPRIAVIAYRRDDRQTRWRFGLRDGDAREFVGAMGYRPDATDPESFDRVERFARALAAKAGWQIEDDDGQ